MQWIIIEVGCDGNTLQNCLLEEAGKSLVEKMWAVDVDITKTARSHNRSHNRFYVMGPDHSTVRPFEIGKLVSS